MRKPDSELNQLQKQHLLRTLHQGSKQHPGKSKLSPDRCLDFSSNDYLGLADRAELKSAAIQAIESALSNPLINKTIDQANGILFYIKGGNDILFTANQNNFYDIKLLVTAEFQSGSNVQLRKTSLQSKDKETVK